MSAPAPPDLPDWLRALPLADLAPSPQEAGDPLRDPGRLGAVDALGAHDADHVQPLVADLLARAADALEVPVALLNTVLSDALVVAGAHGLSGPLAVARAAPAEHALCPAVVRTCRPVVSPDLSDEPGEPARALRADGVLAYAGVPLRTRDGHVLGALCVLDTAPRPFSPEQVALLERLGSEAVERLGEARRS